ncbi:hypothetical protein WMY93_021023 [Mugilogobius chulae]|uniref:Uncharacterized protein n=1 Tax=Mugilogobius chulae TaxID=88201 RepID=A0AAW0NLS1_9GOBI
MALIRQKMELTFSLRRKEIVEMQPLVKEVQQRWPALFSEQQTFMGALDACSIKLIRLFRARKTSFNNEMDALLKRFDNQVSDVVQHRRTICLEGLPVFVRDTASKLFVTCLDTDPLERSIQGVKVGILVVLEDYTGHASEHTVVNTAVVLEEDVILSDRPDIVTACAYLFGLLYGLNIEFPKEHRTCLSGRVSSLRTCLFSQDVSLSVFTCLSRTCLSGRVSSLRTCLFLRTCLSQDVSLLSGRVSQDVSLLSGRVSSLRTCLFSQDVSLLSGRVSSLRTCLFSQDVSLLSGRVSSLRTCLFSQDVSLLSGRVSSLRTCLFSQDVSLLFV